MLTDHDRHTQRQGSLELIAATSRVCGGLPEQSLVVALMGGDHDVVTPEGVRTFNIDTPVMTIVNTLLAAQAMTGFTRAAIVAHAADRHEAAVVSGFVVSLLGVPATRLHVGPGGWSQLDGEHLSGPLSDVAQHLLTASAA